MSKEESFRLAEQDKRAVVNSKNSSERKSPEKKLNAPAVTNQFQDLKYLKTIPKRVDWWLGAKTKKVAPTHKEVLSKMHTADFSKNNRDSHKAPSNRYVDIQDHQRFEEAKQNRKEFLQKHGSMNPKNSMINSIRSLEQIPEGVYVRSSNQNHDIEHQYISYDTYDFCGNYDNNSVSQKNPNINDSVSQECDEKIETLLEKLEESRLAERWLNAQERNMLMHETRYLAMLKGSETLYKIFELMENAQENYKNFEDTSPQVIQPILAKDKEKRDIKMSYDLEFEKLIISLKGEYHSLFEK